MTDPAGRRGSRSESPPARPKGAVVLDQASPSTPVAVALPAPSPYSGRDRVGLGVALAIGGLYGGLVLGALQRHGPGIGVGELWLVVAGIVAGAWCVFRRRTQLRRPSSPSNVGVLPVLDAEVVGHGTDLDRGVQDIRRTDRGFDALRFAGYAGMMFRDVQNAVMARAAPSLHSRLTSAMYVEIEARCDRLRESGRSARFAEVDVVAEVTEAWQDGDRDYVTAYVAGSMLGHTVDDATGKVVDGSPGLPARVEAFLTFTRPAGLNFWMLSIIQEDSH
jgi:predicted lipid-binding transport protein (Tim44 family)